MRVILTTVILFYFSHSSAQSNKWIWLGGDSAANKHGRYGVRGVAAPGNLPGSRSAGNSWTDDSGNFWLFGGAGYGNSGPVGNLNDLWMYNHASQLWTWVHGDSSSNMPNAYVAPGVAAPSNKPASREGAVSWIDTSGNFWLFGGLTPTGSSYSILWDLWKYDPSSNQWTMYWGNPGTTNQYGSYGVKGVQSPTNYPPARRFGFGWTDHNGDLWLSGGRAPFRNDLWRYNIATNTWTWMHGDNNANTNGYFGVKGVANPVNSPSARTSAATWTDNAGNFWLYGGKGNKGELNDLWKYNLPTQQWTWISGDSVGFVMPVYGSNGISSPVNSPGARYDIKTWKDSSGNLWMYGGTPPWSPSSFFMYTDFWKYDLAAEEWTWMAGDSSRTMKLPHHGTKTIGTDSTTPGSRMDVFAWTDNVGAMYLFGGYGVNKTSNSAFSCDLWKFGKPTYTTYTFNGNGSWNNPANWSEGVVPPNPIPSGTMVIISPITGGACNFTGTLYIAQGAVLNTTTGVTFAVIGNIVYQ